MMTALVVVAMVLLASVLTLASYISRVHTEFGRILSREEQNNLDAWEECVEPRLGMSREHAALSAEIAKLISLGLIAMTAGASLFERAHLHDQPVAAEFLQAFISVAMVVLFCGMIVPSLLLNRTTGRWAETLLWPIRLMLWSMIPLTVMAGFFFSVASLSEEPSTPEEEAAVDVEALLEAGEEEGILEESDRDLVRSAVEFGDKLVKEVMTPRPRIFAVARTTTLEEFTTLLREHNYSRVPVFDENLDEITGIAFAHDLLQISDADARLQTVASIEREAAFIPETKRVYELLREMQREKRHMSVVIDEYGGVAGLVTIEDLLEEIVGEIRDEHEQPTASEEPEREPAGSWIVPGEFPVNQLEDLFGAALCLGESYEATTVGGLVSEIEGRIPLTGELISTTEDGVKMEVLASSDRRVERLRVHPPATKDGSES